MELEHNIIRIESERARRRPFTLVSSDGATDVFWRSAAESEKVKNRSRGVSLVASGFATGLVPWALFDYPLLVLGAALGFTGIAYASKRIHDRVDRRNIINFTKKKPAA
ncbi:MAG TPA: hypothetical protein VKC89_01045 [Patescibacteria group bacterium]|nr:hypothetical protein [Patescibacteria group bacterium]